MVQKILPTKNPTLRKISKPVGTIDKKIKDLICDLKDTLYVQKDPEGVGLAAPQIGKNLRVFVVSFKGFKRIVINPKIVAKSDEKSKTKKIKGAKKEILEGCLSLPNYYGPLKRSSCVTIKYLDENGKEVTETFEGFHAQIILHEIDHLNGIIFVDHLLKEGINLYKLDKNDEWEEVELI